MFDFTKPYALIVEIVLVGLAIGAIIIAFERNNAKHEAIGYSLADEQWKAKEASAKQSALANEREHIRQKEEAQNEAAKRQIKLEASIVDLRHQLDRMRYAEGEMRKRISALTIDSARHVAETGIAVFGECADQYSAVAIVADKCLSERQTLVDAWPQ